MASDALTFADVLRDEYFVLHGHAPLPVVSIEAKHVREVEHLLKVVAKSDAERHKLFKRQWEARAQRKIAKPAERAAAAFSNLLREPELFAALMKDETVAARLRQPVTLRRLLRVPGARAVVFTDPGCATAIAADPDLIDLFAAESAAVRLLRHDGGADVFRHYPALLATIADAERLSELLTGVNASTGAASEHVDADKAAANRKALLRKFQPPQMKRRFLFFKGEADPVDQTLTATARSAAAVGRLLNAPVKERTPSAAERSVLNALLLEVAYPDCFTDSYDVRSMINAFAREDMAALCLSGGGIRSATFSLGVLQGLADHGLLQKFHYLSTVSGGGYIGSWFSSWVRRHNEGFTGVAKDLSAPPADPEKPEVEPIQHLRAYSSYLAPRPAAFSLDTWTIVATYIRNLLLNWSMLLPALVAALALPRLVQAAVQAAAQSETVATAAMATSLALGAVAVIAIAWLRPVNDRPPAAHSSDERLRWLRFARSLWLAPMMLSALAFCMFWAFLPKATNSWIGDALATWWMLPLLLGGGTAFAGAIYAWRRVRGIGRAALNAYIVKRAALEVAVTFAAGAFGGLMLQTLFSTSFPLASLGAEDTLTYELLVCFGPALFLLVFFAEATLLIGLTTYVTSDHEREWWARSAALMMVNGVLYVLGSACVIFVPLLIAQSPKIVAACGGISAVVSWVLSKSEKLRPKSDKEQKSAKTLMLILQTAATLTIVLLFGAIALATTAMLPLATTDAGRAPAKIFTVATSSLARTHLAALQTTTASTVLLLIALAAGVALLMSRMLNANIYSMHGMYRNRLIRAYLGASRWVRRPDPFTGFDPQDNLDMFELRGEALWTSDVKDVRAAAAMMKSRGWLVHVAAEPQMRIEAFLAGAAGAPAEADIRGDVVRGLNELMITRDLRHDVPSPRSVQLFSANRAYLDSLLAEAIRPAVAAEPPVDALQAAARADVTSDRVTPPRERPPLHIVNTTLNLVGGDKLAWQERKADSFTVSPLHSGNRRLGYRDSYDYGDHISLGTAMAISGAAVSPNMGYFSSASVTFLMTLLNARLGWWLGNPARNTYREIGPRHTLKSLADEALGKTNDSSDYVFLSDGGHFENLGIYEMVRRRCRFIVACDASADGDYAFADLGNAVRKIRIDTGVPITLSTSYLPPSKDEKFGRYCALGLIHYGNVDGDTRPVDDPERMKGTPDPRRFGYLLYIKPAVYADCPPDVRNYKSENDGFPHESTLDQFFSESQFESYRALGRHVVGQMRLDRLDKPTNIAPSVGAFIRGSKEFIDSRSAPPPAPVTTIVDWVQRTLEP